MKIFQGFDFVYRSSEKRHELSTLLILKITEVDEILYCIISKIGTKKHILQFNFQKIYTD